MRAVTPSERHGRVLHRGDLLLEKSGGVSQLLDAVSPPLFTDDSPTPDYSKQGVASGEHATSDEVDLPASKPQRG